MPTQQRYETATTMPMVEEEITPRNNETLDKFALLPAREGSKYLGLLCLGVGCAIVAIGYQWLLLFIPALGLTGLGVGGLVVLNRQLERDNERPKTRTVRKYQHLEKRQNVGNNTIWIDLANGRPGQRIWQPADKPNAFRQWLRDVLDPNQKKQFSLREARRRGWDDEHYNDLVQQLREIGLLHRNEIKNHAPVCTDEGKLKAREWLNK